MYIGIKTNELIVRIKKCEFLFANITYLGSILYRLSAIFIGTIKVKKTIAEIKKEFDLADKQNIECLIEQYSNDDRSGVKKIILQIRKEQKKLELEQQRCEQMRLYEKKYEKYSYICGIDEVGRGPLAGPVVAGAVILPKDCTILYINDSKKLSEKKREELYDEIMEKAISIGLGVVSPGTIDNINILQATYEAMRIAIGNLSVQPDLLLNDAVTIPNVPIRQVPIIKGDSKSVSIAAASIIAKVTRDRMMVEYNKIYNSYDFDSNKGYGSQKHIDALKKFGPCPIHRFSFIKNFV